MIDKDGMTPRERAYDLAMGWIVEVHNKKTGDIANLNLTPSHEKALKRQLVKLHNKLLKMSGIDGYDMSEEE